MFIYLKVVGRLFVTDFVFTNGLCGLQTIGFIDKRDKIPTKMIVTSLQCKDR